VTHPYLYTGEYYDENTGFYYLRARYMNPETGSFISLDTYQGNAYDPASLHGVFSSIIAKMTGGDSREAFFIGAMVGAGASAAFIGVTAIAVF